tara:strand:+ start:442 stop:1338 length:897 start_codon:yes stop_codon:yes gene_type:complete
MGKVIRLTESDINKIVKKVLIREMRPEPIQSNTSKSYFFYFKEGEGKRPYEVWRPSMAPPYPYDDAVRSQIVNQIAVALTPSIPTLQQFLESEFSDQLSGFISLDSSTSHTGKEKTNSNIGEERLDFVEDIVYDALDKIGFRDTRIKNLLISYTDKEYDYSNINQHMDPDKLDPNAMERSAFIGIQTLSTMGLDTDSITDIEHDIERASGTFSTDEESIVNAIEELETYSDIVDLNKRFRNNLQYQINSQITDGVTYGGSDTKERRKIVNHLNKAARRSGKADVAAIVGDKITITLTQ